MSFESYPIVTTGSNIDIIRQGHNLITTNVGDIDGLQTQNKETVVDAINSLQIAFNSLIFSAYPPLNNEQWLTANNFANTGTLNLFKLNSNNELIVGQSLVPFSTLTDLGKSGTGYRAIYGTTLHISAINAHTPTTRIPFNASAGFDFNTTGTTLSLTEVSATQIKLESTADQLDIISTRTRILSGVHALEIATDGHILPGANGTQNFGATDKKLNKIWAKELDVEGAVNFPGTVTFAPLYGGQVPIGAGMLWFGPDNQVPANYLILRGDVVSQTTYAALFALYGTTFNTGGEGAGNFRLPDMRNRIPFGANPTQTANPDARSPGLLFGSLNHTHSLPAHGHVCATFNTTAGDGTHSHPASSNGGAVTTGGAGVNFEHRHDYNHAHAHYLGTSATSHSHGSGTLTTTSAGSHTHTLRQETSGSGSANTIVINSLSSFGVDTTSSNVNSAGSHTHNVTGNTAAESSHTHGITGGIYDTNSTYGSSKTGWMEEGSGPGTLNAHTHTIGATGSGHNHNIPAHNVGNIASANGDNSLTSGTNNPPCFAMWFIIRAR